jgi:uncharacterized membrane protein (DUF4010 family)
MTVSMSRLMTELSARTGAYALLAGVASNILTKVAISAIFGRRWFAVRLAAVTLVCLIAGWLVLLMTLTWWEP